MEVSITVEGGACLSPNFGNEKTEAADEILERTPPTIQKNSTPACSRGITGDDIPPLTVTIRATGTAHTSPTAPQAYPDQRPREKLRESNVFSFSLERRRRRQHPG